MSDATTQAKKDVAWGKRTRVVLDVGCGVASFGGYLFERDALAMSFAPKDEHEAQVQFYLHCTLYIVFFWNFRAILIIWIVRAILIISNFRAF